LSHFVVDAQTGQFASSFEWSKDTSVRDYLQHVRITLETPDFGVLALNADAASMYRHHSEQYRLIVRRCCEASQRLSSAHAPPSTTAGPEVRIPQVDKLDLSTADPVVRSSASGVSVRESKARKKATAVSFLDYFTLWHGIATTKSNPAAANQFTESVNAESHLQRIHYGAPYAAYEAQHRAKLDSE
jgi:hypothetical protein